MTNREAQLLRLEAQRLGLNVHERTQGREIQMRFTGDHWHRSFKSCVLALLGEIPTGATMPMFQGWALRK